VADSDKEMEEDPDELAVVDLVADPDDELEDAPEMWNGNEYWKIVASESSVILNP